MQQAVVRRPYSNCSATYWLSAPDTRCMHYMDRIHVA